MASKKNAPEEKNDLALEALTGSENQQSGEEPPIDSSNAMDEQMDHEMSEPDWKDTLTERSSESLEGYENQQTAEEDNPVSQILNSDADLSDLTPEERRIFGSLIGKISFRGPKTAKASKKDLHDMLSGNHRVHTRSGASTVATDATNLREDMLELAASANSRRILKGKISGVREIDTNAKTKQYIAKVAFGHGTCQVLIPDFVLFNYNYDNRLDPETQKKVFRRISSMIGSEIDFTVKHWDAKNKTAYGDRLKAMESLGWNFYCNEKNPDRVLKEMIVEATVIAVRQRYLVVNALGVDAQIPIDECGWEHYLDLREHYRNNDVIEAKVLEISTTQVRKADNEIYDLVGLQLSIRQTVKDPREKYWDEFRENGIYLAEVTSIDPNGNGVFVMIEGKVPALCAYPSFGALPVVNEERLVQITEKTIVDRNGVKERRIFGVFKNV